MIDQNCLFCKIVSGQIPATIIEKTDRVTAFNDIMPQAPVHILIIPNQHLVTMAQVAENDLKLVGEIIEMADKLIYIFLVGALSHGRPVKYRIICNGPQSY
jgi:histidine triad (HIT) family protein